MAQFFYTVRTKEGKLESGSMEAVSEDNLVTALQSRGYIVISVSKKKGEIKFPAREKKEKPLQRKRKFHSRVKTDDMIIFSRQLATMLEAGVTLLKSLEIISQQIESRRLYLTVEEIKKDIERGHTFRDALAKYPKVFSKFWVNLVETGEASGHLPSSLEQLANFLEASGSVQRKVISALVYPAVLSIVAVSAIAIFVVKIIPIFTSIFVSFNVELPLLTQMVIKLSEIIRYRLGLIIVVIVGAIFVVRKYIQTEWGRWNFDRLKLKLPIFGPLFQIMSISRFANSLGTLIKSGVPILHGLEIVEKSTGNKIVERAISKVKENVREGKTMADPLEKSVLFPPMFVQMVRVGEEIGELSKMLDKVSEFYDERVTAFVERLASLFEPIAIVIMGGIVGVLVVSMFLPIFQISQIAK